MKPKNMVEIVYRNAKTEDYTKMNYMHSKVNDLNSSFAPFILKHADITLELNKYTEMLNNSSVCVLIALKNDQVAGFLIAEIRHSSDIPALIKRKFVHVSHFGVDEEYRRLGVGTELFNMCIRWGKENNCDDLEVMVMNNNVQAISFYESVGLEAVKKIYNIRLEK